MASEFNTSVQMREMDPPLPWDAGVLSECHLSWLNAFLNNKGENQGEGKNKMGPGWGLYTKR